LKVHQALDRSSSFEIPPASTGEAMNKHAMTMNMMAENFMAASP
jgi:hypothetical protein